MAAKQIATSLPGSQYAAVISRDAAYSIKARRWHDKIAVRDVTHAGRRIRIFGC